MQDTFYLETDEGTVECAVITTLFDEERKKNYVVYEYVNTKSEDIYVSSYDLDDETHTLEDVSEEEIKEIAALLESDYTDDE